MDKPQKDPRGRKPNEEKGLEKKKTYGVYLYPSEYEKIVEKYGSLSNWIEKCKAKVKF